MEPQSLEVLVLMKLAPTHPQNYGKCKALLHALQTGAPPHGGSAFGLDRLKMLLAWDKPGLDSLSSCYILKVDKAWLW